MNHNEKHLIFKVREQLFTVSVLLVNTIIQVPRVFKVPQAPEFVLGVINVEGDVIPLIDAAQKLGMEKSSVHNQSQVIILHRKLADIEKTHQLAFLVQDVCDVADVDPKTIQNLPTSRYDFDDRLVDGMYKINEEFCMQINIENFFKGDIDELIQQITTQQAK